MDKSRKIFSDIYDKNVDKIYRFVFLKVNSQEVAEDLTSKAFIRGWDTFRQGADIDNPSAFLYKIARNLVIDHYREKGKMEVISAEFVPQIADPRIDLEGKLNTQSDLEMVKQALKRLKGEYQEVIIWHYLDDLSISEIAKISNKPEGTIRVTLHRALKILKNEFEES